MKTATPLTLHGLPVMSPHEAELCGFKSITINIDADKESKILAGVCQHRDPTRACLIREYESTYQLAIRREDISNLSE